MAERVIWIDEAKGVAMMLVMIGHYYSFNFAPRVGLFITAGFMPLFFILSGITYKNNNLSEDLKKRIKRLIIPYIIYGIISNIIIFSLSDCKIHDLWKILLTFVYGHNLPYLEKNYFLNTPIWFIPAILTSYIYFFLMLKRTYYFIIIFALSLINYMCNILLPFSIDIALVGSMFIYIGYHYKNLFLYNIKKLFHLAIIIISYIMIVNFNGTINMALKNYGQVPYLSTVLFIIIGVLYLLICKTILMNLRVNILNIFLQIIGRNSLRIMCLHMPIFFLVKEIQLENHIVNCVISILFSVLISNLIEIFIIKYKSKYSILLNL